MIESKARRDLCKNICLIKTTLNAYMIFIGNVFFPAKKTKIMRKSQVYRSFPGVTSSKSHGDELLARRSSGLQVLGAAGSHWLLG